MLLAINLLVSTVQIYEVYLIYQCFFRKIKVSGKWLFFGYLLLLFLLTMEYLTIKIPIVNFMSSFLGVASMTLFYKDNWKNRLIAFFFNFGAMFTAEAIVSALFGYVNADLFSVREYYSYFGMVCLPLVQFLIVLIIRNYKNLSRREAVPTPYWIISIALPILSIYLYFQICSQWGMSRVNLFLCSFILLLINILVIFLYDRQIKTSALEREKEVLELQAVYQEKQYQLINETVEKVKSSQHDFRNHLNAMFYLSEKHDWEALQAYIGEFRERILEDNDLISTGSINFDGVLNYKMQLAQQEGIDMDLQVIIPYDIYLEPCDITVMLGNLLDNSIEAAKGQKGSWIKAKILYRQKRLSIRVSNTYHNELILQDNLYKTNKQDKKMHGYGLKNIREVVEQYDGVMETKGEDGVFTVNIVLFLY